jgi:hypothetical protein
MADVVVRYPAAMVENAGRYMSIAKGVTTHRAPNNTMIHVL